MKLATLSAIRTKSHQLLKAVLIKRGFMVLSVSGLGVLLSLQSPPTLASRIEATGDNFVVHTQPNTVQPAEGLLVVKKDSFSFSPARKAWISFDINSLDLTNGQRSIDAASFLLTTVTNGGFYTNRVLSFDVFGLTNEAGDNWSENTLTWNNAPGNDSTYDSVDPSQTTYLGRFSFFDDAAAVDSQLSISGQALRDFLMADTNGLVTLIVTRNTVHQYATAFASSETGAAGVSTPHLDVAVVPIPGAVWLFGSCLGGISLVGCRKKLRA